MAFMIVCRVCGGKIYCKGVCRKCYHKNYNKQHYKDNREKIRAQQKEYNKTHKEKIKEYNKNYRIINKEQIRKRNREYCRRPEVKAKAKKYYKKHYQKKQREDDKTKTIRLKKELIKTECKLSQGVAKEMGFDKLADFIKDFKTKQYREVKK